MLNDPAIPKSLDIHSGQDDALVGWCYLAPFARVCSSHRPPGHYDIFFGNLAVHCDNQIWIAYVECQQVLSKPGEPLDRGPGHRTIARDKLRQTIHRTCVDYLLQQPASESSILCFGHNEQISSRTLRL